jgi:acyl transferase domain-containing protein
MLGYSGSEYVAACLAGVMAFEDALIFLAKRARVVARWPRGAMLEVPHGGDAVRPLLTDGIELAALKSPSACLVAGTVDAITTLAERLCNAGFYCCRVDARNVLHSSLLRPLAPAVESLLRDVVLHPPRIPFLSNLTGTWISAAEATDRAYWIEQMCRTVQFEAGASELLKDAQMTIVEVGAGQSLGSYVKENGACTREWLPRIFSVLPGDRTSSSGRGAVLGAIGRVWQQGVTVDWNGVWGDARPRRVRLPTYPFERHEYWLKASRSDDARLAPQHAKLDFPEWFQIPTWSETATNPPRTDAPGDHAECWIVFEDGTDLMARVVDWVGRHRHDVVRVTPGKNYLRVAENTYTVRPTARADYARVLLDLQRRALAPSQIVHAWSMTAAGADALELGFFSLVTLGQALMDADLDYCTILLLTSGVFSVTGLEDIVPERAAILGPATVIPAEAENLRCRCIDVDLAQPEEAFESLIGELTSTAGERAVALRGGRRWVEGFARLAPAPAGRGDLLRRGGVYLITGGFGGIGFSIAERLVREFSARVALVGRSAPDMARCAALAAAGGELLPIQADVADAAEIELAVRQTLERFGVIHGVVHAAGVPGSGLIAVKQPQDYAPVLLPKVQGTMALACALERLTLDFLVLFSSVASVSGGPGQADYCAASAFLDAFSRRYHRRHGVTVSIAWCEWQWNAWTDALLGYAPQTQAMLRERRARLGLTFDEGFQAFRRALAYRLPNLFVSTQDMATLRESAELNPSVLLRPTRLAENHPRPFLGNSYVAPRNDTEEAIAAIWREQLGLVEVGVDDNFFELGGNSLVGTGLIAAIRRRLLMGDLPAHTLYEAPTIRALAAWILRPSRQQVSPTRHGVLRRQRQLERRR